MMDWRLPAVDVILNDSAKSWEADINHTSEFQTGFEGNFK